MQPVDQQSASPDTEMLAEGVPVRPKKKRRTVILIVLILSVLGLPVLGLLGFRFLFSQAFGYYYIPSESMEPTLMGHDAGTSETGRTYATSIHDQVLVDKGAYRSHQPQHGDIVVFNAPKEADVEHSPGSQVENVLIKRILGVPGDTIEIKQGAVYRNGKQLQELYILEPMDPSLEPRFLFGTPNAPGNGKIPGGAVHLGPNQFWVMGDNRNNCNDSRYWGTLESHRIIGKLTDIIAPAGRERSFR